MAEGSRGGCTGALAGGAGPGDWHVPLGKENSGIHFKDLTLSCERSGTQRGSEPAARLSSVGGWLSRSMAGGMASEERREERHTPWQTRDEFIAADSVWGKGSTGVRGTERRGVS